MNELQAQAMVQGKENVLSLAQTRTNDSREESGEQRHIARNTDHSSSEINGEHIQAFEQASLPGEEMAVDSSNLEMGLVRIKTEPPDPDEELVEPVVGLVTVKAEPIDITNEQISQDELRPPLRPEEVITDDIPAKVDLVTVKAEPTDVVSEDISQDAHVPVPVRLLKISTCDGVQNQVKLRIGKWKQKLAGILKVDLSNKVVDKSVVVPMNISPPPTTINAAPTQATFSYVILSYQKGVAAEERRRILARERQRRWRSRLTNEKKKMLNELQAKRYARKRLREIEREAKLSSNGEKNLMEEKKITPSEERKTEMARGIKRGKRSREVEENLSKGKGRKRRRNVRKRRKEVEEDKQLKESGKTSIDDEMLEIGPVNILTTDTK